MTPKIISAEADEGKSELRVTFSDGTVVSYSIKPLFGQHTYGRLRNWGYFKNFQIAPGGHAIYWDDDTDLSEHEIYTRGEKIATH